jgi:hypothetical protein
MHIITMTKQSANAGSGPALQGDGAPDSRSYQTKQPFVVTPEMVAAGVSVLFDLERSRPPSAICEPTLLLRKTDGRKGYLSHQRRA